MVTISHPSPYLERTRGIRTCKHTPESWAPHLLSLSLARSLFPQPNHRHPISTTAICLHGSSATPQAACRRSCRRLRQLLFVALMIDLVVHTPTSLHRDHLSSPFLPVVALPSRPPPLGHLAEHNLSPADVSISVLPRTQDVQPFDRIDIFSFNFFVTNLMDCFIVRFLHCLTHRL
jgi:hypothetical protein